MSVEKLEQNLKSCHLDTHENICKIKHAVRSLFACEAWSVQGVPQEHAPCRDGVPKHYWRRRWGSSDLFLVVVSVLCVRMCLD